MSRSSLAKEDSIPGRGNSLCKGMKGLASPVYLRNGEQFGEYGQVAGREAAGSLGQIVKAESWAKKLTS